MEAEQITNAEMLGKFAQTHGLNMREMLGNDGQRAAGAWWRTVVGSAPMRHSVNRLAVSFLKGGRTIAWAWLEDVLIWAQTTGNVARYQEIKWAPAPAGPPPAAIRTESRTLSINGHPLLIGATGTAVYARADRLSPSATVKAQVTILPVLAPRFGAVHLEVEYTITTGIDSMQDVLRGVVGAGVARPRLYRVQAVASSYRTNRGVEKAGLVTIEVGVYVPEVLGPAE